MRCATLASRESRDKSKLLAWLVSHHRWRQVLVFTRTKHGADNGSLAHSDGIRAVAMHGDKTQTARTQALAQFNGRSGRGDGCNGHRRTGIDIDQLPHVVNYDLPNVPRRLHPSHRPHRTRRREGEAISLVCVDEHVFLRDIERLIKRSIPRHVVRASSRIRCDCQKCSLQRGRPNGSTQPHERGHGRRISLRGHQRYGSRHAPGSTHTPASARGIQARSAGKPTSYSRQDEALERGVENPKRLEPLVHEGLISACSNSDERQRGDGLCVRLRSGASLRQGVQGREQAQLRQAALYQEDARPEQPAGARNGEARATDARRRKKPAERRGRHVISTAAAGVRVHSRTVFSRACADGVAHHAEGNAAPRLKRSRPRSERAFAYHATLISRDCPHALRRVSFTATYRVQRSSSIATVR